MLHVENSVIFSTLPEKQSPPFGCRIAAYVEIYYSKTIAHQADTEEVAPLIVRPKRR